METADLAKLIRDRAAANGVDPSVLLRFAQIESSMNPNAGNDTSSAKGLFQFTNGTARQYGLSDPMDPVASSDAAARLLRDNAAKLASAGLETSPGALYLAHFAGAGGAQRLLTADPSARASDVLGDQATKANPFIARMTVADLKNWAAGKMGGAPAQVTAAGAVSPAAGGGSDSASGAPMSAAAGQLPASQDDGSDTGGTDAALAALRNIYAQRMQAEQMPAPQIDLLRQIAAPRRTVYLNG